MKSIAFAGNLGKDERDVSLTSVFSPPPWSGDTAMLNYPLTQFCPIEHSMVIEMPYFYHGWILSTSNVATVTEKLNLTLS